MSAPLKIKVVYSARFGGFSLSTEAVAWLKERGVTADDDYTIERWGEPLVRHDTRLVACVEALGDKANGSYAALKIAEVDGKYRIDEYDGFESVQTTDSYDWVTP